MARDPARTVYIGNLDEKVNERVLYEILVQVGYIVDLYIPRDKETNRQKGYAFVEYESEEIAEYAVRLFSGLVCLHNKLLKFAISRQDRSSSGTQLTMKQNSAPYLKLVSVRGQQIVVSQNPSQSMIYYRVSSSTYPSSPVHLQCEL